MQHPGRGGHRPSPPGTPSATCASARLRVRTTRGRPRVRSWWWSACCLSWSGQRLDEAVEATGPALCVAVAALRRRKLLVREDELRALALGRQLDRDQRVAVLGMVFP